MREEVIVKSEEVWRVFGLPENLFIFSREAKTICDFIRPPAKKPRLDRELENR